MDKTVRLWDPTTPTSVGTLDVPDFVRGAASLPDGRVLVWFGRGGFWIWDGASEVISVRPEQQKGPLGGVRVVPDGRLLSWARDGVLFVHDASGQPTEVFAGPRDWDRPEAAAVAAWRAHERAGHHSLHLGFTLADARDDVAVLTGGRHLRICRFVPAPP